LLLFIIEDIYTAQDRPKADHKCAMLAAKLSTVYTLSKQLNRNVFSCVPKVSTETLVNLSAAGIDVSIVDGIQTAKLLTP